MAILEADDPCLPTLNVNKDVRARIKDKKAWTLLELDAYAKQLNAKKEGVLSPSPCGEAAVHAKVPA